MFFRNIIRDMFFFGVALVVFCLFFFFMHILSRLPLSSWSAYLVYTDSVSQVWFLEVFCNYLS